MGLHKNIKTPEELWKLFQEFKKWLYENPLIDIQVHNKTGELIQVPKQRPLTWERFDTWIMDKGILQDLEDYRLNTDGRYEEFKGVISRIRKEMYSNKFEGATVNMFNANIIARDLGLKDHTVNELEDKRKSISELFPEIDETED